MVDEALHDNMRIRSLLLAAIMTLSSLSVVIASDTITTQDVDISGNYTMNGKLYSFTWDDTHHQARLNHRYARLLDEGRRDTNC